MEQISEREFAIKTLQHHKLKVTNSRLMVLQILSSSNQPMTVKDIGKMVTKSELAVTEASIYVILRAFLSRGLVNKYRFETEKSLYSLVPLGMPIIATCSQCQMTLSLHNPVLEKMLNQLCMHSRVILEEYTLSLIVRCQRCNLL
ncbi:MAG: hypothetical protein EOO69_07385 [Moraxellaceae bacterium]|nr:MAG: hypothetical protein EOO69_07385 [Moraxellaceae bacterium]